MEQRKDKITPEKKQNEFFVPDLLEEDRIIEEKAAHKAGSGQVTEETAKAGQAEQAEEPAQPVKSSKKQTKAEKAKAKQEEKRQKEEARRKKEAEKREERRQKKAKNAEHPSALHKTGKAIASAAAAPVFLHDRIQARSDRFLGECGYSLLKEYHDMQVRYKGTSRKMVQGFFSLMIVTCALLLFFEESTVYQYAYNGRVLGYVKSEDTVVNLLNVAGKQMSGRNNANIKFRANENVTFNKVSAAEKDVDDADVVINKLTYMTDIEVSAVGIYEDGKLLTIVENESTATALMNEVLAHYNEPDKGMEVTKLQFKQLVETNPIDVMLTSVQSKKDAEKSLIEGGDIQLKHIIKEGETVRSVAQSYNVDMAQMTSGTDGKTLEQLRSGDMIVMNKTVTPLKVIMTESGTMSEVIPFEQQEQQTDQLYIGDTQVQQEGQDGRQLITGKITRENGVETDRKVKKKEVLKEMVPQITLVGTNEKPKTASTGTYQIPVHSAYTMNSNSYFGPRWGRMHNGLDFSVPTGTPVYAADGGTVTTSNNLSGYGNAVLIRHDDGTVTLYGHNSKVLVSVGEKVYQGQEIALAGSTGRSTGPHVHFEIRLNGTKQVNPAPYLGIGR